MARHRQLAASSPLTTWSGALHKSFRLLPTPQFGNEELLAFFQSDNGTHKSEILRKLPYDRARSGPERNESEGPDAKRYRDPKQVFETCGLLWEDDDGRVRFTEFGLTLKHFLSVANPRNVILIARHAALALSVCQLRNPTGAGSRYSPVMQVFPYRCIWQAMLAADYRINSPELNRAVFRIQKPEHLAPAIESIYAYRETGDESVMGNETVSGDKKNDRIIPVVAIASFGWTLIDQKDGGYYRIKPECIRLIEAAVSLPARHREYDDVKAYVTTISNAACLPKDRR